MNELRKEKEINIMQEVDFLEEASFNKENITNNIIDLDTYKQANNNQEQPTIKKNKPMSKINFTVTKTIYKDEVYKIQFELRKDNEITAVGVAEDIVKFFRLEIQSEADNGYILANNKDGELRYNIKSYKYRLNHCTYRKEVTSLIKSQLEVPADEKIYFYRPGAYLMNEEQCLEYMKRRRHYSGFNSFAKSVIKRQIVLHKIFNRPFDLKYNLMTLLRVKYL